MVDLDSNPTKLIEIVEIGKQLLMTRGSLTTFSIANDVAKYFAIIPAMFVGVLPALDQLNVMNLSSPRSAILSAVIFNALIIVALVPLALRGVQVPRRGRGRRAAPQPAGLRPRRPHRPVRRHQAHRHHRHRTGSRTDMRLFIRQLRPALARGRRVHRAARASSTRWSSPAIGQVAFDDKADGSLIEVDGGGRRQRAARPDVHVARVLPAPAVGRRRRLRRLGELGVEPRPDQPRPARRRSTSVSRPTARRTGSSTTRSVPVDAVTASGSGLDPHISVANARLQAPRVAAERGLDLDDVLGADRRPHRPAAPCGVLGEPAVNVLALNLALDELPGDSDRRPTRRLADRWPEDRCASTSVRRPASARPTRCSARASAARSAAPTSSSGSSRRTDASRPPTRSTISR